jgi:hypothetical protein
MLIACSSAGPWLQKPAGIHGKAADLRRERRRQPHLVLGHVALGEQATVLGVEARDRAHEVALVEGVPRRFQPGASIAGSGERRLLLVRHVLQASGEIGLHEKVADLRRSSVREIDRAVRRPAAVLLRNQLELLGKERVHHEPVPREADREARELVERSGAVAGERLDPGAGAAGTTVRSKPSGISPPWSRSNNSQDAASGQIPTPSIVTSSSRSAIQMIIGATRPRC